MTVIDAERVESFLLACGRWAGLLTIRQARLQEYSAAKLQQNFFAYRRRKQARVHRQKLIAARNVAAKVGGWVSE